MNTSRISTTAGGAMIVVVFLIDGSQFFLTLIPLVGWIIAPVLGFVAAMIFGIWCSHLGVSLMSPKRVFGFLGTAGVEFVPFVDSMWWWTIFIAYTVITEWR